MMEMTLVGKLVYVRPVGQNTEGHYEYDLLFSEHPQDVWTLFWDEPNPSSCGDLTPDRETYDCVARIVSPLKFSVVQESSCFSMEEATHGIVALSWVDIENLEEYPSSRCVLHFGDDVEVVRKVLTGLEIELADGKEE